MRWMLAFTALCLLTVAVGTVAAQDSALGTPTLKSPNALPEGDVRVSVDWRNFDGSNDTFTGSIEYGITDDLDIAGTFVRFDNVGDSPVGGAMRRSELDGPGVSLKWVARKVEPGTWGVSIIPGVEFLDMRGTNIPLNAWAGDEETIFTLEVSFGIPDGDVLWIISPKLATFPDTQPVSVGPRFPIGVAVPAHVDHFDTIVGLGLGIVAPLGGTGRWSVFGDVTPILEGDNAIDEVNNRLDIQLPWTAGVRWEMGITDESHLDVYVTTAAGGTTATSLIASPDRSVGFGGRATVRF